MAFGTTDVLVVVEFKDQPAVLEYMRQQQMDIPSSLDILPCKQIKTL